MTLTLTDDSRWGLYHTKYPSVDNPEYDCHIDARYDGFLVATMIRFKDGRTSVHPYFNDFRATDKFPSLEDAFAWVVASYLLD